MIETNTKLGIKIKFKLNYNQLKFINAIFYIHLTQT